jgi:arginine repressor
MAKKKPAATATANRSQAIRDYLAANGNQSMKEIKEGLSAQGLEVSEALISKVKYRTGSGKKKGKRSKAAASSAAGEVNKSEAIRDAYKELGPKTRTKDIVAALAEKGITVAPAQVSTVKAHMKTKRKGRASASGGETVAAPSKRSANGSTISAEDLLAAKRLANQLGGVERLKSALAVLDQLK